MTKQEIKEYAAAFGFDTIHNGNNSEDNPKGFRFTPVLLNTLKNLEINQTARLRTLKEDDTKIKAKLAKHPTLTFEKIESQLRDELKLTIERIEEAKNMKTLFEQTKVYTTEMQKYETSTV